MSSGSSHEDTDPTRSGPLFTLMTSLVQHRGRGRGVTQQTPRVQGRSAGSGSPPVSGGPWPGFQRRPPRNLSSVLFYAS